MIYSVKQVLSILSYNTSPLCHEKTKQKIPKMQNNNSSKTTRETTEKQL